jgi:hypothetical protein
VSIDPGTVQVLRDHRKRQVTERLTSAGNGAANPTTTCSRRRGESPFTQILCHR